MGNVKKCTSGLFVTLGNICITDATNCTDCLGVLPVLMGFLMPSMAGSAA